MAREPKNANPPAKAVKHKDAEQEMLMREVDEAVRQDEVTTFAKKYGWPLGIAFVVAMLAFGGFLLWQDSSEGELEAQSNELIQAIDELEAGNTGVADEELAAIAQGEGGVAAMATMLRGGIAAEAGNAQAAAAFYDEVAANEDLPAELRDVAAIRSVTVQYDDLEPQQVIDRIGPLAVPDNPYYGSAGELVAHAYLALGRTEEAGALLAELARSDEVPPSIQSRTQRLVGTLGIDTIDDVDELLSQMAGEGAQRGGPAVELAE
ncbi:tetratricopeptide repeat protein [Aurantiacibacter poecillastricola]|uniref:tetratricopeptide repeat protein n=1 Tax=Aurantiacibacter poecillastricola TaxID=3064385 RepID=UPI00273EF6C0|nr:tetratricopeptide repeat protein [Aurantiacibacter sp. 219JJ12-13]MDP5261506.1 tetratricopeptide repeat protein [Aurantiacibacter sp. 219JJ12-13]